MKKITRKQLVRRLEGILSKEDAKKIGESIKLYSQSDFDSMVNEYESEEKEGFGDLVYDMNIESIIGDLFYNGLTAEDIEREFLNFYSINSIVASESGEGLMFIQA